MAAKQTILVNGRGAQEVPGAPGALRSAVSGSVVSLSWDAPAGAVPVSEYRIEAGSSTGGSDRAVLTLGNQTTFNTVAPAGVYYVRVRALHGAAVGPPSPETVVAVGGGCAPFVPGRLVHTVSGRTVTLTWSAPTSGAAPTGYAVEAGSLPGRPISACSGHRPPV